MSEGERTYRVALLRADEAAELTKNAQSERHPAVRGRCCQHLDVFHNYGERPDSSRWKRCSFLDCKCEGWDTQDDRLVVMRRKHEAWLKKHEHFEIAQAWWLFGAAVGALAGWLLS